MKNIIRKNYKFIIGLIVGLTISATIVYGAEQVISGNDVSYNNGTSQSTSDNVQGAIDELYKKAESYKNINYISTVEDLEKLRDEVNKGDSKKGQRYALISDLDLGGKFNDDGTMLDGSKNWKPIGTEEHPFSGTFDGMGHIIKKLYSKKDSIGYVGLFGYVFNGTIKNLGIENSYSISTANFTDSSNDMSNVAMLVGYLESSTIDSCYNQGNVKGKKTTGGLVGRSQNSTISNCYNTGIIDNSNNQFAGGIVGYGTGTIKNCYNAGKIIGTDDIGGIIGGLYYGSVINTYNLGDLSGNSSGGIVGQLYTSGSIKKSYNSRKSLGGIVYNILTDANQKLEDNHYLKGVASYGIYTSSNNNFTSESNPTGASPLEKEQMPEVLEIINEDDAFKVVYDKNNPILKWES